MKKIGVIVILAFIGATFSSCSKEKVQVPYAEQLTLDEATIDSYLTTNGISAVQDTSGLRYVINKQGTGTIPQDTATVPVEVTIRLLSTNAIIYMDTAGNKYVIADFIAALQDGITIMRKGSSYRFYVPSGLGYGSGGSSDGLIPANANLIIDIKLLDDDAQLIADVAAIDKFLKDSGDSAIKDPSGVRVIIVKQGTGATTNGASSFTVTYVANFIGGSQFDSQTSAQFYPTGVISGFKIGLSYLKVGGEAKIYVPSGLAYGFAGTNDGTIKRNANLVFDATLVSVQ